MADQNETAAGAVTQVTLAALYLCTIAYTKDITKIPGLVGQAPPLGGGGRWTCLWGPVEDSDQTNLVFVAGYSIQGSLKVVFVTIRGTDIDVGIWGILKQIYEDLDATSQVAFPTGSQAFVANGTIDGLTTIQKMTFKGKSLLKFLQDTFAGLGSVPLVVTGHSLGACLATVVAQWMQWNLRSGLAIQPITFAAPTAGNQVFANNFDTNFHLAQQYQNTLDTIPHLFDSLPYIVDIYSPNGLDAPDSVWTGVFGMQGALLYAGVTYAQPMQGRSKPTGVFDPTFSAHWYCQAWQQHHPSTYLSLLTGQPIVTLPCSVLESETTRLAKRFGSVDHVLKQMLRA